MSEVTTDVPSVPLKQADGRFGLGLILLSPLVWFSAFAGAFGSQTMFFGMDTYLKGSDVTSSLPALLTMVIVGLTIVAGLSTTVGPISAAGFGVVMIFLKGYGGAFSRAGLMLLSIPLVSVILHNLILLLSFLAVNGEVPRNAAEILPQLSIAYALSLTGLGAYWWRLRKYWPKWTSG